VQRYGILAELNVEYHHENGGYGVRIVQRCG
jgi:hypothetical protein